jgi:mersacidin/lichenicidin family type 2 lantibiotic
VTREHIVSAWKNSDYREQLTPAERATLPEHPCGESRLGDSDLDTVVGGATCHCLTLGCDCGGFTNDPGLCTFGCPSVDGSICTLAPCS